MSRRSPCEAGLSWWWWRSRAALRHSPSTRWAAQLSDDPKLAARGLAAIDAGIAQADAKAAGEAAGEAESPLADLSDGPGSTAELIGVFSKPIMLPVLIIVGQLDPGFEAGRETGMRYYAHARMAMHENGGGKLPQDDDMAKLVVDFLRGPDDDA